MGQSSSDIHLRSWELAETLLEGCPSANNNNDMVSSTRSSLLMIRALDDDNNDKSLLVLVPVQEEVEIRVNVDVMAGLGSSGLSAETSLPGSKSSRTVLVEQADEDSAELWSPPPPTTTTTLKEAGMESSTKVTTTAVGLVVALTVAVDASFSTLQVEEEILQPSTPLSLPAVQQPHTSKHFLPKAAENNE